MRFERLINLLCSYFALRLKQEFDFDRHKYTNMHTHTRMQTDRYNGARLSPSTNHHLCMELSRVNKATAIISICHQSMWIIVANSACLLPHGHYRNIVRLAQTAACCCYPHQLKQSIWSGINARAKYGSFAQWIILYELWMRDRESEE